MNTVDLAVLAVLFISALLAFMRGLVREVLGVGAWIGAVAVAATAFHLVQPRFREWIANPDVADPVAFGAVFLAALIILSVVANMVGGIVRLSMLSGLDRTLGLAFGLARGAGLVAAAYILGGMVMATDRWPEPVLQARSLPYAYQGAAWAIGFVPPEYRPTIYPPPPAHDTKAAGLQFEPWGRAVGHP